MSVVATKNKVLISPSVEDVANILKEILLLCAQQPATKFLAVKYWVVYKEDDGY